MAETKGTGGVKYTSAGAEYFEKRKLKRSAGVWGLWGLAVAAVISGDFSGWNFGIASAGFGGMAIAFVILVVMYYGLIFSIGEMAAAMPHTGGAYSFARSAMGPWGGLITGLAETIEYVATTAVIVFFSAQYLNGITTELLSFDLSGSMWIWWIVLYLVFIALNSAGASISFKFAIIVSIISIAILLVFSAMALISGKFNWDSLFNIAPDPAAFGSSDFLPGGLLPILFVLPFAMWFFLGIEELPLAAEESHAPAKDIPRAGIIARGTLIVTGVLVLVLNTGVLGAEATGASLEPLLDGFRAIVGDQLAALLAIFALIGLLASLQGIMFAYGRNMYSLSRAGYYPKFFSLTGKRQTPWVALVVGAVFGFVALVVVDVLARTNEGAGGVAGAIVLNIAVWGAVFAYFAQMVSFIILRRRFPNANRPYKSPWGIPGAAIAALIALSIFVGLLVQEPYRIAIVAIIAVYLLVLLGFAIYGRHRLVLSPEEEYALSGGLHGDPQKEGYDAMEGDVPGTGSKK
ncbi:amino acid permease [Pseudolysinimonas yzui]|uniref:Amino acid ABC transporter permease n=1 Tax=Pseudolysinimonas yzui TaxID=2708254 RepID=A0A8J3GQW6_9MICO|nr:amino acid permease [Pseudolysinimonas yzui]GHF16073.1 amino acid ABC transporter permease [Pseudolysinimonas yzui]